MFSFSILNWFGLRSLRQRYFTTTIIISIFLLFAAYFGWRYVEHINQQQLQNIENRTGAADAISDVIFQFHTIEKTLQNFIVLPTVDSEQNIKHSCKLIDDSISKLHKNTWIKQDDTLSDLVISLATDNNKLVDEVQQLVDVRKDEKRLMPVITANQEQLLNHNLQFTALLDFYITGSGNELVTGKSVEIYKLLNEIRYSWQKTILEFHLFESGIYGAFSSDHKTSMGERTAKLEFYIKRTSNLLNKLDTMVIKGGRNSLNSRSLKKMKLRFSKWETSYKAIIESLQSEDWRQDYILLQNNIQPMLNLIYQRSSSLQLELGVASAKNITELTSLARNLSDFVILLAIILTAAGLLGYIVFNRTILLPIKNFSLALKYEASDKYVDPSKLIISKATEFENLRTAFIEMRNQIRSRQSNLDHMAHHDALTQLPNRTLLRDRLELAISRTRRDESNVGLIFLDLDRFKKINDSLGHEVGDHLLRQVANRLLSCVRSTDTVARLGGDEFAIVVEAVSVDQIGSMARKILAAFVEPFKVGVHELYSTTSIGIAMGPTDDDDVDALIKDADIAMYHAKDLGRNNYKFYSSDMAARVAEYMVLENQLHHAVDENQFFLMYQPIVDIKTGELISTEALLRWNHPDKGILGPDNYLTILEDSGLIRPITQWVLIEASRQYNEYKNAGFPDVRMSVNLSGTLLKNDSILDIVINALEQTKIDPAGLIMEITEGTLLEDLQGAEKALVILKDMGIQIALDDFGTGQSSLSHLRMNPIDIVKIDRSFVRDIPEDKNDMELVDAIIAMAHKLHMKVVAEGVETREQEEFLRWHGCDAIQGYYYSDPVAGSEIMSMLTQEKHKWHG
jgi:diguanylate cyclase (GGDEF)-like protein